MGAAAESAAAAAESGAASSYMARTAADVASEYSRVFNRIPSRGEVLQYMQTREDMRRVMSEILMTRSRNMWLGVGAGAAALLALIFVFRHETKKAVVVELSDVASRSLGDEKMQAQAQLVTIQTLQALLEHGETVQRSVSFLSAVAEHEQTREALTSLLVSALKSPAVINEALELVLWVLDDARAREHLVDALISSLENERFLAAASEFATHWIAHEDVRATVSETFKQGSLQVLEDANVHDTAEQFVQGLLTDSALQAKTSEHLWAAVKGLVIAPRTPTKTSVSAKPAVNKAGALTGRAVSMDAKSEAAEAKKVTAAAEAAEKEAKQLAAPGPLLSPTETSVEPLPSTEEGSLRRRQSEALAAHAAAAEATALAAAPASNGGEEERRHGHGHGAQPPSDTGTSPPTPQTAPPAAPAAPPSAPPPPPSATVTASMEHAQMPMEGLAAARAASPPVAPEVARARRLQESVTLIETREPNAPPRIGGDGALPSPASPVALPDVAAVSDALAVAPAAKAPEEEVVKPAPRRKSWRELGIVRSALGDPS